MPAKSTPAPKSRKADGTEKKRWSAAERKDRGHDPRRRGGQSGPTPRREGRDDRRPSGERSERPAYSRDDRRSSSGERTERPAYNRDDRRPSYGERTERPAYNRDDRRPSSGDRGERPAYNRDDRRPAGGRDDRRPSYGERTERPAYNRDDRRPAANRDDRRPSYGERTERPAYNRDDRRPSYGDRTERPAYNRDDRRPSYGERSERPAYNRDDRRPAANRDDRRPSYGDRTERPAYNRDDRRPSYGERSERPAYNRDDRRPSYGDRTERPAYNRDDRRPSGDRGDRPAYNRDDRRPAANRDDRRPSYGDRTERPAYNRDDRRPSYGERSERPASNRDDRRPSYGDRTERPAYNRDDRRPSSGDRSDRPAYNRDDRRSSYGERSERPADNRDDRRQAFEERDERSAQQRAERTERPDRPRTAAHREERAAAAAAAAASSDEAPVLVEPTPAPADEAPVTDEAPVLTDEAPTVTDEAPAAVTDEALVTDEATAVTDEAPAAVTDEALVTDEATAVTDEAPAAVADEVPVTTPQPDTRPLDRSDTPQEHQHVTITEPTATTPTTTDGDFASLGLPPSLVSALTAGGITAPFPIQAATIPDALTGRDVLGRGQTGSGKTLAFGLPMLARLAGGTSKHPRGLVLVPTRELAMQVTDVLTPLARTLGLSTVLIAGGMSYTPQLRAFQRGVDVVVATPGRLIDLMDQNAVDLTRVETIVLDEADHMADLGFMPAVTQILDTIPAGGQRMLFSATLDGAIDRLVKRYLSNPVTHEVDSGQASVTTMAHHLVYVAPHDKATLTAEIAGRPGRTVVFVRTQRGADRVAEQLRDAGVMAGALHGGLTQGARTRILSVFKEGDLPVLVATDVAARGIHVDEVGLVLQVDPPAGPKEYLHRAGRTARAGGTGVVVTLALPHQRREMTRLTSQAGVKPQSLTGAPGDAAVADVTGAVRPTGVAVSAADYERLIAPPRSNRRPSGDRGSRGPRSRSGGYEGRRPQRRSFER
ncbi:DEAD/DEAH box helicase [Microlunatus capsulatus]|uniref:Superfamily II DNA/RNA helicase/transcription elongation factor n=1 Tax=Microlunatus capsulatus TaxID=99117 RepID=A0ABS4Z630_9ACTN|nr:DEAD/DEAH box helicase [Microlunatus capsulatus]MBP2416498.1 superfamily II DNA/RNA helicase/transcription elongation factor [Microlunatus capsulatus]